MGPLNSTLKVGASQVLQCSCEAGCGDLVPYAPDHRSGMACDVGAEAAGTVSRRPPPVSKGRTPIFSLWRFVADAAQRLWSEPEVRPAGACKEGLEGMSGADGGHQRISTSSLGSATATDTSGLSQEEHRERRGTRVMDTWEDNNQWELQETTEGWEEICWMRDGAAKAASVLTSRDRCDSWTPRRCDHELKERGLGVVKLCAPPPGGSLDELERCLNKINEDEDGPLTLGTRSAPAEYHVTGFANDDIRASDLEGTYRSRDSELWDSDDCFFYKEHKTVLDSLEHAGELRRRDVLDRVTCEKKQIQRLRNDVRARKLEFELLKSGMSMVTPQVAHLRRRWGSKQRIKCRERLARIKQSEEEDLWSDIPLLAY